LTRPSQGGVAFCRRAQSADDEPVEEVAPSGLPCRRLAEGDLDADARGDPLADIERDMEPVGFREEWLMFRHPSGGLGDYAA
jgi:hypothetical protein